MILLVNKKHLFNEDMIKDFEMVEYENINEEIHYLEAETFKHFEMLRAHLKIEGILIEICSGYRSLEKQESIFLEYMNKFGIDYAEEYVAMPGTSEHHTGLAIDLGLIIDGKLIDDNDKLLKEEKIFKKIHDCLKYFGFILRYKKGCEAITGFSYEPWHIRYVGEDVAMDIGDMTLEEYLGCD